MYITVNDGTKIHYIEKGQGTPLLLIAGGGFSGNIFKYQIDFLAETRHLFIFDMRAQGKSDRVKHGIRISRLAMDLKEIIDKDLTVKKTEDRIKSILEDLTEEKDDNKRKIKSAFNFRIYLNTLKNAYNAIKDTGIKAEYNQKDKGEYIEVTVKIPKNQG